MSTFYPSPPPQHQQRRLGGNTPLEIPRSSYPSPPHPQSTTSPYNPHLRYNPALYNSNANTPISPYPGPRVASQSPHRSGEYNPRDFGGLEYGRVVTPPVQQQFQPIQPQQTGDPPPPPYSPPVSNTNTPAPTQQAPPTRHAQIQRIQTQSWGSQPAQQQSPATPHQYYTSNTTTPSTAAFSPMSPYNQSMSSSQATPLTPFSQSSGFHGHRRNVSPPPSGLQHQTSFEGITEVVPPPPPPGPPPQQQHHSSIPPPPPPPGPPPHQRMDSPHRSSTQTLRNESPAPAQSPQGRQNMTRSPVLNEMYPRTSSLVTTMGNRVAPSVSTTNVTATGQFQQPPQQQYQQQTNQAQSHFQQATQAYQSHTNTPSQSSTATAPVATTQQQSYSQPQQAQYHQSPVPQLAAAPPPPPKRKMSIDFGHEHLRNSPRLAVTGQPVISEARSPIEPSNNPWRGMLQTSPPPNNQQQPRQLLTPPPTTQDNQDLLDLASTNSGDRSSDKNLFTGANTRHHEMIRAEAEAKSDDEAINIFINWVKQEWELREQKYGLAAMRRNGAKVGLVLRKNRGSVVPDLPSPMLPDGDTMMSGMQRSRSRRQPSWWGEHSNPVSPTTVPPGFSSLTGFRKNPRSVLSAAFEDDEQRSRGRASSRWWESSQNGDSEFGFVRSDGVGVQYSGSRGQRRPTKSSLREIAMEATNRYSVISQATDAASYMGKAEYPPDYKGGVQGVAPSSGINTGYQQPTQQQQQLPQVPQYPPQQQQQQYQQYGQPLQAIQEQQPPQQQRRPKIRLDILPLLTLLPPYPRTFPAVNNCHPQLADFRNMVRNLNDLEELHIISKEFQTSSQKKKENAAMEARKRRHQHSEAVQQLYQDGKINYEQVDAMDRDFESEENDRKVAELKEEFERFQKEVVDIVHSGLMERIALASESYDQVQAEIVASSANSINNRDKEGDEIPELLEKLTLLKWLFDLKEILYREVHELLKGRNRRYKDVIVTPFYNTRQGDRIREAEEFFTKDELARRIENDQTSLKRFEEFLTVMEENVLKGVEIQISCFWDIAPLVSECFEKIPHDLENVEPIVPPEEAHENPGYEENPLIYLKEKVYFAERSCYQFVEAQTNLLCLLHEVKTSLTKAKWRLNNSEGKTAGPGDVSEEIEERRLTDDLKEKVKLLESEWKEAIGNQFEEVRERLERQVRGEPVAEA